MGFKSLLKHEYARHIAILCSGTVIAQVVSVCTYPILSRLFTPDNFGLLATFTQIASILTIVASCKYETNILIEEKEEDAVNLIYFIVIFSFLFLSSIFIITEGCIRLPFVPRSEITKYIGVPFVMAFMIIIYQCYNEWCTRKKSFQNLSCNKIINTSSLAVSEIIFGLTRLLGGAGLFIGDMLGRTLSAINCIYSFNRSNKINLRQIQFSELIVIAKKNINCPKFVMPAQLLNVIGGALPVLLIGYFFNQTDVGFYSMANMVIVLPCSVISLAIRDVFRQKASVEYASTGQCKNLYIKNLKILTVISLVIFTILFFSIKIVFSIFLGNEWLESAVYARVLIPMVFISFVSDALSSMMIISKNLKYIFYWQTGYFLLSAGPLIVGGTCHSIFLTLGLFSVGRIIAHIANLIISYRIAIGKL